MIDTLSSKSLHSTLNIKSYNIHFEITEEASKDLTLHGPLAIAKERFFLKFSTINFFGIHFDKKSVTAD